MAFCWVNFTFTFGIVEWPLRYKTVYIAMRGVRDIPVKCFYFWKVVCDGFVSFRYTLLSRRLNVNKDKGKCKSDCRLKMHQAYLAVFLMLRIGTECVFSHFLEHNEIQTALGSASWLIAASSYLHCNMTLIQLCVTSRRKQINVGDQSVHVQYFCKVCAVESWFRVACFMTFLHFTLIFCGPSQNPV